MQISYLTFMEGTQNIPVWGALPLPGIHHVLLLSSFNFSCYSDLEKVNWNLNIHTYTHPPIQKGTSKYPLQSLQATRKSVNINICYHRCLFDKKCDKNVTAGENPECSKYIQSSFHSPLSNSFGEYKKWPTIIPMIGWAWAEHNIFFLWCN